MKLNGKSQIRNVVSLSFLISILFFGCASSPKNKLSIDMPDFRSLEDEDAYTTFKFSSKDQRGQNSKAFILIDEEKSDSPDIYTENLPYAGKMTVADMTNSFAAGETIELYAIELNGKYRGYLMYNSSLNLRSWFNEEVGVLTFTISSDSSNEVTGKLKWSM